MTKLARNTNCKFLDKTTELSFRLQPSAIEGVGVFACHGIAKGARLRLFAHHEKGRIFPFNSRNKDNQFIRRYSVELSDGFHCPADFGRMSIGWYLNHSPKPNAGHKNYKYYALRNIKAGEEITVDYRELEPAKPMRL